MTWKPTTSQLETIADMANARAIPAAMAAAVGLSLEQFIGWRRGCVAAARAEESRHVEPEPMPDGPVMAPQSPRIVAERLFEGDPATERMPRA